MTFGALEEFWKRCKLCRNVSYYLHYYYLSLFLFY